MPKVKEYLPNVEYPGPVDSRRIAAEDFGAARAQGGIALGQGIQNFAEVLQKRNEQVELSKLHANLAETSSQLDIELAETIETADPNDDSWTEKAQEKIDLSLEKIGESVQTRAGQDFLRSHGASLKGQYLEKIASGKAQLAGKAAALNYQKTEDALTAGVASDPSTFEAKRTQLLDGLGAQIAAGMPRHVAEGLARQGEQKLALTALKSWVSLDPNGTKKEIASGKWDKYINGDMKRQLFGDIESEIRGRQADAERARLMQERALEAQQKKTQNEFLDKLAQGQLTWDDVKASNLSPFGSGSKEQFMQMMKAAADKPPKTDPTVFRQTLADIYRPDGDPKKIVDENQLNDLFIAGKITYESLKDLRSEISGNATPQGRAINDMKKQLFQLAETRLVKPSPMGVRDPLGEEQLLHFQTFFFNEYKNQRAAGKSDLQLLSPESPDYLGKHINTFMKTPQQILAEMTNSMKNAKPPAAVASPEATPAPSMVSDAPPAFVPKPARKPGETAAEYIQRLKDTGKAGR